MPQLSITQLPPAQALTGTEAVPVVQNGLTVQTTAGALAGAGALNYPFLTVGQAVGLTDSRYISTNAGLSLTDNGAQNTLQINLIGAAMSLNSSGNGIQVKTASNTVTAREIAVGTGLGITNADGVSGNPTVALGTFLQQLVSQTGTGFLVLQSGSPAKVELQGTTNQISIANGNGSANPIVSLATNPIIPGTGSVTVPNGTTVQRSGGLGAVRYNTNLQQFEGFTSTGWNQFSLTGGVTSFSAGTTGFSPSTATTGAVTLDGILSPAHGGTGINNSTNTITLGGNVTTGGALTTAGTFATAGNFTTAGAFAVTLTATGVTSITLPTSGTLATLGGTETLTNKTISGSNNTLSNIANASLTNSSVTYNGVNVALGASGTLTATTTAPLTIGTGLTGTSFNGSTAVTIAIDSTVATLTGTQTLTNKTISGATNTLSNIGNSSLTNSQITLGTTNIALGATSLAPAGLTSVTVTQNPTADFQLATKQYVDGLVSSGITYHTPVQYEVPDTTGNLTATYNQPGGAGVGVGATLTNAGTLAAFTPDGIVSIVGDRVLVYNQTNQFENGIYTVTVVGDGSTAWVLTRATDADTYALKSPNGLGEGDAFFVTSGLTGAGETYVVNTVGTIVFGTTAITFAQISDSTLYTAGTGLTLTGTQFSISNTAVVAATYGSASNVPVFAVNAQGQLTSVTNTPIAIANTQVSGLGTMSTQNANNVSITGGSINGTSIGVTSASTGRFTNLTVDDNTTLGSSNSDDVTFNARIASEFTPATNNTYDLGRNSHEWRDLYLTGTAYIDTLNADTADINGGTIDGTSIGATAASTGAFTTISASGVITSTVTTGTAPFTVASTTAVANLTATNTVNTGITAATSGATNYLTFVTATSGNLPQLVNSSITANADNGTITGGIAGGAF